MAKSVGYKMNKHLKRFLENVGLTAEMPHNIFTIRAICGKFQEEEDIASDLVAMTADEQTDTQQEAQAA